MSHRMRQRQLSPEWLRQWEYYLYFYLLWYLNINIIVHYKRLSFMSQVFHE